MHWGWKLVIKHDSVKCGKSDAQPTRTHAQKEEPWGIWLVTTMLEAVHLRAAFQWAHRTIYAAQWPAFELGRPILGPDHTVGLL